VPCVAPLVETLPWHPLASHEALASQKPGVELSASQMQPLFGEAEQVPAISPGEPTLPLHAESSQEIVAGQDGVGDGVVEVVEGGVDELGVEVGDVVVDGVIELDVEVGDVVVDSVVELSVEVEEAPNPSFGPQSGKPSSMHKLSAHGSKSSLGQARYRYTAGSRKLPTEGSCLFAGSLAGLAGS